MGRKAFGRLPGAVPQRGRELLDHGMVEQVLLDLLGAGLQLRRILEALDEIAERVVELQPQRVAVVGTDIRDQ